MKKVLFSVCAMVFAGMVSAQSTSSIYMRIVKTDKTELQIPVEEIDSIDFLHVDSPECDRTIIVDGHACVDLGLPSGLLWATCNVGAAKVLDTGNYYAWGEVETKTNYSWDNYQWAGSTHDIYKYCTKYSDWRAEGEMDNKTVLDAEDDVASVAWGGAWRMPTKEEMQELYDNCQIEWKDYGGITVVKMVGPNGNFIVLPLTASYDETSIVMQGYGYYWTSTCSTETPCVAWTLLLKESSQYTNITDLLRKTGRTVRPVCTPTPEP